MPTPTVPVDISDQHVMRAWYQALRESLEGTFVNVKDFDAQGNGSVDDTFSFKKAIAQAHATDRPLYLPAGTYKITEELALTEAIIIFGDGPETSIIEPHLTSSGGNLFAMTAGGNLTVKDIGFEGSNVSNPSPTAMVYMINVDPTSGTLENINIDNCRFSNLNLTTGTYGVDADGDLRVTHCIFLDNVDNVSITNCHVDDTSGCFVFAQYVNHIVISNNYLKDVGWYPIHLDARVRYFDIAFNTFNQSDTQGSLFGGFIDVLEDTTVAIPTSGTDPDKIFYVNGTIRQNFLAGYSAYASVINVLSASGLTIKDNVLNGIAQGTLNTTDAYVYHIHIGTRAASSILFYGPPINITIDNNFIRGSGNGGDIDYGIRVDNDFQSASSANDRRPIERVSITNNTIGFNLYDDDGAYSDVNMDKGIYVDGKNGGVTDVLCEGNTVIVTAINQTAADGLGAIDFVGTSVGNVDGVRIGANRLHINGTVNVNSTVGIAIGQYVNNVVNTSPNFFRGFYTAVETISSGLGQLHRLDDQVVESATAPYIFGTTLSSVYHTNLSGTTANRPASGANLTNYMIYFDTSEGIPIWYNGSSWVDAIGGTPGASYVDTTGTPADNQLAIFTDADTLEGDANLTWDGSTFTLTGSMTGTGAFDFGGATDFEIPNSATPTVDTAGQIAIDTTITDHTGLITYYDGTEALFVIAVPTANLVANDGYVISYNATNNEFEMVANAASSTQEPIQRTWFGI